MSKHLTPALTITSQTRPEHLIGPVLRKNRPGRHARKIANELMHRIVPEHGHVSEGGPRDSDVIYQCHVRDRYQRTLYTLRVRELPFTVVYGGQPYEGASPALDHDDGAILQALER